MQSLTYLSNGTTDSTSTFVAGVVERAMAENKSRIDLALAK